MSRTRRETRGMPITEDKTEYLKTVQKSLYELGDILEKVMNGEILQSDMARKLGVTPQRLNTDERTCFSTYLRRVGVFSDEEFAEALRDCMTPCERVLHAVFGMETKYPNKLLTLEIASEEAFEREMSNRLTERELKIIRLRYGFDGKPMIQKDVGKVFGVTTERIRQIEAKALRKLRNPSCTRTLLPSYQRYTETVEETSVLKEKDEMYKQEYAKLMEEYSSLVKRGEIIDSLNLICEESKALTEDFENTSLEDIDEFPKPWLLHLRIRGVWKVGDLKKLSEADLLQIAKSKGISLFSLFTFLEKFGITPDFAKGKTYDEYSSALDIPIADCFLSVRAYNCLRKRNLKTLGDIVALGSVEELLKTRNLGVKSAEEVLELLHQNGLYMGNERRRGIIC